MAWRVRLGSLDWLGGPNVNRAGAGGSTVERVQPEWERHYWNLRGGRRQEAVADTNSIGAERVRSVCVRAAEKSK